MNYSQLSLINPTFNPMDTDETAVYKGKALPISMDWEWLAKQCVGNTVRVFNQALPHQKITKEYEGTCFSYHVCDDHVLFEFLAGPVIRSHGYGWVRYFHVLDYDMFFTGIENLMGDACVNCGAVRSDKRPLTSVHIPTFCVSGGWIMKIYKYCNKCYDRDI